MEKNTEMTLAEYRRLSNELLKNLTSNNPLYPGSWWENCFKKFMRQEDPWDIKLWETWKKISYGGTSVKELKYKYKKLGNAHDVVLYILNNLESSSEKKEANLLVAPIKMLGFNKPATITEVNYALLEKGFCLLTPELSISLLFEIDSAVSFHIAMDPICMRDSQQFSWVVSNGKLYLYSNCATFQLPLNYDIVFSKK